MHRNSGSQNLAKRCKIAYVLHHFPHLSETFIMREMYWLRKSGVDLYIFSLLTPLPGPIHAQAAELIPHSYYSPFLSWPVLMAQLYFLRHFPQRYIEALALTMRQTYREPGLFLRALVLFPKSVYFARRMEALGIEHIHAHFAWLGGITAAIVSRLLCISFTIHPHAFDLFSRNPQGVRRELESATKIITISTFNRDYITALCPRLVPEDIAIVRCGVDIECFRPIPKQRLHRDPVGILSIGRLIEKKGFEYLIDACARLSSRSVNFKCKIVGTGPLQKALQTLLDKYKLHGHVSLLGARDQEQILQLLQNNDIFVLPCVVARNGDRDGIPVVLMEAMACELPVVTTSVAGIPELVRNEENGLLVEERNPAHLADALERLIADEGLRQRLGRQARQTVSEGFQSWSNVARLAAIFQQQISHHSNDNMKSVYHPFATL